VAYTYDQLLAARRGQPRNRWRAKMGGKARLQWNLAKKDFYPDFNFKYMWQSDRSVAIPSLLPGDARSPVSEIYRGRPTSSPS